MTTDNNDDKNDGGESPRHLARQQRRMVGSRSAKAAHTLIQLPKALLENLALDDDLREEVDKARAITSHSARRRVERHLTGLLRQVDVDDLETRLSNVQKCGPVDARLFKLAETWRARLIEEGAPAADAFSTSCVGGDQAALAKLIAEVRREQTTGRPRGAARALFRLVMAALQEKDQLGKITVPAD